MARRRVRSGVELWARYATAGVLLFALFCGLGLAVQRGGDFVQRRRLRGAWRSATPPEVVLMLRADGAFEQRTEGAPETRGQWTVAHGDLVLDDGKRPSHLPVRFDEKVAGVFLADEHFARLP